MPAPIPFTYDDGGRSAAGFKGEARDCVARAVSIAAQRPYETVYAEISAIMGSMPKTRGRKTAGKRTAREGVYTRSESFRRYMVGLGFTWTACMSIGTGCRVHLAAGELPQGRIIARVSKHYAAVVDGVLRDTSDCSRDGSRCVYGYWTFEGKA